MLREESYTPPPQKKFILNDPISSGKCKLMYGNRRSMVAWGRVYVGGRRREGLQRNARTPWVCPSPYGGAPAHMHMSKLYILHMQLIVRQIYLKKATVKCMQWAHYAAVCAGLC